MPKSRPPYPAAFRQQMVELVRSGRTPGELAREFEPSAEAIRNWVAQADRDAGERTDGLSTEDGEELSPARRIMWSSTLCDFWGIHLTGARFDVLGHDRYPAGARGLPAGWTRRPPRERCATKTHRQPSTSESPANATAGAQVPVELGAASGEPPVDNHGVEQLRLHGYPRMRLMLSDP